MPHSPAAPPRSAPSPTVTTLSIALMCLIWGSTWIVIRSGLTDLPPFTSAGARFAVAAAVMLLIATRLRRLEGGAAPGTWLVLGMGLFNIVFVHGIVYWSETRLPSGLVAVLWGIYPMLQAVCGHVALPDERLRALQWLGFAVGFAGVAFLFLTDLADLGPEAAPTAAVLLLSPASAAVGSTLVKRCGAGTSSVLLNRNGMIVGALMLSALALVTEGEADVRWTAGAVASVVYLGVFGTVVAFGLYFWLLRYASAYKLSLIAYVTPAVALTLGWFVGSEPVTWNTLTGTVLILMGVGMAARRKRA